MIVCSHIAILYISLKANPSAYLPAKLYMDLADESEAGTRDVHPL